MMYKLFLLSMTVFLSCGAPEVQRSIVTGGTYEEKVAFPFNDPRAEEGDDLDKIRSTMQDVIDLRKNNMKSDLFEITYYYIAPYGFANKGKRIGPDAFEGMWLKFGEDFSYKYGVYDKEVGSGIYHYSSQDFFLMLIDDDKEIEPRLFSVQSNSEFFNFIGRPIMIVEDSSGENLLLANWANDAFLQTVRVNNELPNGMQIMMTMLEEQPAKPATTTSE